VAATAATRRVTHQRRVVWRWWLKAIVRTPVSWGGLRGCWEGG
jgi:hypothetical protein